MQRFDGSWAAVATAALVLSLAARAQSPQIPDEASIAGDCLLAPRSLPENPTPFNYFAPAAERGRTGIPEPTTPDCSQWLDNYRQAAWPQVRQCAHLIWEDHKHFYSWENLGLLGLEVGLAAPLANTSADLHIHQWYQHHMRSTSADQVAWAAKQFGEFTYTLPAYAVAELAGRYFADTTPGMLVEEWGNRSLRAMIVGAPPLGVLQVTLGSGRPNDGTSPWRPFHSSHGVSGHAFVGSVPFLTAAAMTDKLWLQCPLIVASAVPAWSRVNDGVHFTSQAALGWCLGCAAVVSVNATQREERAVRLLPSAPTGEPGVCVHIRY